MDRLCAAGGGSTDFALQQFPDHLASIPRDARSHIMVLQLRYLVGIEAVSEEFAVDWSRDLTEDGSRLAGVCRGRGRSLSPSLLL